MMENESSPVRRRKVIKGLITTAAYTTLTAATAKIVEMLPYHRKPEITGEYSNYDNVVSIPTIVELTDPQTAASQKYRAEINPRSIRELLDFVALKDGTSSKVTEFFQHNYVTLLVDPRTDTDQIPYFERRGRDYMVVMPHYICQRTLEFQHQPEKLKGLYTSFTHEVIHLADAISGKYTWWNILINSVSLGKGFSDINDVANEAVTNKKINRRDFLKLGMAAGLLTIPSNINKAKVVPLPIPGGSTVPVSPDEIFTENNAYRKELELTHAFFSKYPIDQFGFLDFQEVNG